MTNKDKCNHCRQCYAGLMKRAKKCPCRECIVKAMCAGALIGDECDIWIEWYFENEDIKDG